MTIEQILENAGLPYQYQNHHELIYGARRNANIWIKISISNITNREQVLLLQTGDVYLRYMWAYITEGKKVLDHYRGGIQMPYEERLIPHRNSVFPVKIPSQNERIIYLKIDGRWDSMQFPITLLKEATFLERTQTENILYGIFFGFLGMVSLLGLVLYIVMGQHLLLWYFLYALSTLFYYICITGFDFQYLFPHLPTIAHHSKLSSVILSSFFLYPMVLEYFKEEQEDIRFAKKLFKIYTFLISCLLLLVFTQDLYLPYWQDDFFQFNFVPVLALGLIGLIVLYTIIKITWHHPKWQNVLFLVGYSFLILQVIIAVFVNNGVIQLPFSFIVINIGATILELTCLSILFSEKLLALRREKRLLDTEVKIARIEKNKAEKIRELDRAKTRLYTNITHEFRTPLTVIKGLTEQIQGNADKKSLIQRNSDTLLRLINQMLDLSKADKGKLPFQLIQDDIIQYIRFLSESFRSWGATKNIRLHFLSEISECVMDYDPDKLQDILSNLLSNAIKSTPKSGDIYIIIKKTEGQLAICIKDTGKGIEAAHLPHIFDRFYQVDQTDSRSDAGSGIGLALCKELVQIMGGNISAKSEVGVGSEFKIQLPITHNAPISKPQKETTPIAPLSNFLHKESQNGEKQPSARNSNEKQPTILVVEDNADVQHYLSLCLEKEYQLIMAENGKIGIKKALEVIPDLILSDIMMPDTNGLELCEALKTNEITSHIPIILLTAKANQKAKIQGLSRGADAYLTKPFNKEELNIRIQSLIEQRSRMQTHFFKNTHQVKDRKYTTENQFLNKLKKVVLAHVSDKSFDVQRLSFELKMSRSQVYRKVKALTGRSIASYIRYLRLQEGKKLLETTNLTISEVAYKVGFNDLSYFSNSFSQEFGYPPNVVRK